MVAAAAAAAAAAVATALVYWRCTAGSWGRFPGGPALGEKGAPRSHSGREKGKVRGHERGEEGEQGRVKDEEEEGRGEERGEARGEGGEEASEHHPGAKPQEAFSVRLADNSRAPFVHLPGKGRGGGGQSVALDATEMQSEHDHLFPWFRIGPWLWILLGNEESGRLGEHWLWVAPNAAEVQSECGCPFGRKGLSGAKSGDV